MSSHKHDLSLRKPNLRCGQIEGQGRFELFGFLTSPKWSGKPVSVAPMATLTKRRYIDLLRIAAQACCYRAVDSYRPTRATTMGPGRAQW